MQVLMELVLSAVNISCFDTLRVSIYQLTWIFFSSRRLIVVREKSSWTRLVGGSSSEPGNESICPRSQNPLDRCHFEINKRRTLFEGKRSQIKSIRDFFYVNWSGWPANLGRRLWRIEIKLYRVWLRSWACACRYPYRVFRVTAPQPYCNRTVL